MQPQETCDVLPAQAVLRLGPGDAPAVRRRFERMSWPTPGAHLEFEFERSLVPYALQPGPSSQTVLPTERSVRRASTMPIAMIWTALDLSPDGSDILCIRVVSDVVNGLRIQ